MRDIWICLLVLFILLSFEGKSNGPWELIKEGDGIQIYTKPGNNPEFVEIKGISEMESSLKACVALMKDVDHFKEWMHATRGTSMIEKKSDYHFTYYMYSDFPWPAKDRDVVIDFRILRNPETKTIYTKSRNLEGIIPKKEDIRRIPSVNTSWRFIPLKNNRVRIVFQTRIKPGVQLPDWLADKIYNIGPYNTIQNMKQFIQKTKYQSANINMNEI